MTQLILDRFGVLRSSQTRDRARVTQNVAVARPVGLRDARLVKSPLTIFIPQRERDKQLLERLQKLAESRDRSVNYMAVQAILEYLERQED